MKYAISDLHGQYELWRAAVASIEDHDTLYVLGDCIDRGRDGIKILLEVLRNPRCVMLMGNHEEFLLNYLKDDRDTSLWMYNGGYDTMVAVDTLPEDERRWLKQKLIHLPYHEEVTNANGDEIFLSHSGYPIYFLETPEKINTFSNDDFVWDRNHIGEVYNDMDKISNRYMVHGHTPVISRHYYRNPAPRVSSECDGHKINIDMGCFQSCKTAMLNLDTFEVTYFRKEVE